MRLVLGPTRVGNPLPSMGIVNRGAKWWICVQHSEQCSCLRIRSPLWFVQPAEL